MAVRSFYGRKPSEADIPEANQQEEMFTQGNPVPDNITEEASPVQKIPAVKNGLEQYDPEGSGAVISEQSVQTTAQKVIDTDAIHEAQALLQKYKEGKARLEQRVKQDELFWELRQWEAVGKNPDAEQVQKNSQTARSTSAWLFNSLVNKHSDAMDNFPEPLVTPRERSDEQSAEMLKSILPVVLRYNKFKNTYRENWWDKLVHGTAIYGTFWDHTKENGMGDIDVRAIDILKLYWEPGIKNIQDSRNIFITELVDTDLLQQMYPEHKDGIKGNQGGFQIAQYLYDESIDTENKSCVIDWYYKVHDPSGRTVLHYVKFVDDEILYASENDPELREEGIYRHGKYPITFDVLFPYKGTPAGFGYVSVERDPQMYIDALSSNILTSSLIGTKKRYMVSGNSGVNEEEFADINVPFVHVTGSLDEDHIREIKSEPIAASYINVLQMKIEEMKETSSNRDVSSGGSTSGITAASAISALQEAGNKVSRNMISTTYDAFSEICELCIELMRQFYDEKRAFRIVGANEGQYDYVDVDNSGIREQAILDPNSGMPMMINGEMLFRKPIFDVEVQAQKRNPFSTMEANQRAQELYAMGFFNPERAQEALGALEMMQFEGKDKVLDTVKQGQTLLNVVQQLQSIIQQQSMVLGQMTGIPPAGDMGMPQPQPQQAQQQSAPVNMDKGTNQTARQNMTSYGQRLAARSAPDMNAMSNAANPAKG